MKITGNEFVFYVIAEVLLNTFAFLATCMTINVFNVYGTLEQLALFIYVITVANIVGVAIIVKMINNPKKEETKVNWLTVDEEVK